jgi:hypothetical protein
VRCEDEDARSVDYFSQSMFSTLLKLSVAGAEHLVNQEYIWMVGGGNCEHQAHYHSG